MNSQEDFFVKNLLRWFRSNSRVFPWREKNVTPYEILVAELMLKKTRAENVVGPYLKFIKTFPTPDSVIKAQDKDLEKILKPLGLIEQRIKAFKTIFKIINDEFEGNIPNSRESLLEFPYVGQYTADAVLCFGFSQDIPIVDVNVTRICNRCFDIEVYGDPRVDQHIWKFLEKLIPKGKGREFNLAILDFGSLICTSRNPKHEVCPFKKICSKNISNH
jgi:A/G-specific adenine glycosylase